MDNLAHKIFWLILLETNQATRLNSNPVSRCLLARLISNHWVWWMATQILRNQTIFSKIKSLKELILLRPLKSHPSILVAINQSHKVLVKDRRRLTKLKGVAMCLRMRCRSWITNSLRHSLHTYTKLLRTNSNKLKISRVLQQISSQTNFSSLQHQFKNLNSNLKFKTNSPWPNRLNSLSIKINLLKDSALRLKHQTSDLHFLKTNSSTKLQILNPILNYSHYFLIPTPKLKNKAPWTKQTLWVWLKSSFSTK